MAIMAARMNCTFFSGWLADRFCVNGAGDVTHFCLLFRPDWLIGRPESIRWICKRSVTLKDSSVFRSTYITIYVYMSVCVCSVSVLGALLFCSIQLALVYRWENVGDVGCWEII